MSNTDNIKPTGRLLAIGDIHGCLKQLKALLQEVKPTQSDQVVFLGDYVDRGPDSAGVLTFLIEFEKTFPKTVFLRGNHEQMFSAYLNGKGQSLFLMNGGINTLNSYEDKNWLPVPDEHVSFLRKLPSYFIFENFLFVHAGLRPNVKITDQDEHDMLWIRQDFITSDYDWGKTIVYGHTPLSQPFFSTQRIGLDTGCVYGRQLTCCDVRNKRIWQSVDLSG